MLWVAGPFLAACVLLAWSGATKLARPSSTADAARAIGLASSPGSVRVFGGVELVVAIAGALIGGLAALGVAALFLVLAGVAWRLRQRAPGTPCGCLGASTAPASVAHVVVDLVCAAVALTAAFGASVPVELGRQPFAGLPFAVLVLCAARLAALTMETGSGETKAEGAA